MKKIIFALLILSISNSIFAFENYWKFLTDTIFSIQYRGTYSPFTDTYDRIGTDEELAENNNNSMLIVLQVKDSFCIKKIYKPYSLEDLNRMCINDNYVIVSTSNNGTPILIGLPSFLYIPDYKVYSTVYGCRKTFSENGDFWKGFYTGLTLGFQKRIVKLRLKLNYDTYNDPNYIWKLGLPKVKNQAIEIANALFLTKNLFVFQQYFDELKNLNCEVNKINDDFYKIYSILPPTISRELLRKSLSPEFTEKDKKLCSILNRLESESFHQSCSALEGRGLKNYLLRNSELFGEFFPILVIIVLLLSIYLIRIRKKIKKIKNNERFN